MALFYQHSLTKNLTSNNDLGFHNILHCKRLPKKAFHDNRPPGIHTYIYLTFLRVLNIFKLNLQATNIFCKHIHTLFVNGGCLSEELCCACVAVAFVDYIATGTSSLRAVYWSLSFPLHRLFEKLVEVEACGGRTSPRHGRHLLVFLQLSI